MNQSGVDRMHYAWTDTAVTVPVAQTSSGIVAGRVAYDVFDFCGKRLGMISVSSQKDLYQAVKNRIGNSGTYLVKSRDGTKTYRISITGKN